MEEKNKSPEGTNLSWFNRYSFAWLNVFIYTANHSPLEYKDLYENLKEYSTHENYLKFEKEELLVDKKKTPKYLWYCLYQAHKNSFYLAFLLSIILICLNFVPSLLLNEFIKYLMKPDGNIYYGLSLSFLLLFFPLMTSTLNQNFLRFMYRFGLDIEVTLQALLYRKILFFYGKSFKFGELMSLVTFDSRQIGKYVPKMYFVWQTPIMIWITFWMIYYYCGNAVFIGILTMCCLLPLTFLSTFFYTKNMESYYKNKDERGKFIAEMLSGIKLIKFFSLETKFQSQIEEIRSKEFSYLKKTALLDIFQSLTQKIIVSLGSMITIIIYAWNEGDLDLAKIFTVISFFNLLEKPIIGLGENIFDAANTLLSVKRIQNFIEEFENNPKQDAEIDIQNENSIIIENASFNFDESQKVLEDINLTVKNATLTSISGETASGKSSLLQAISGNISKTSGNIKVNGSMAYCSQTPWLLNTTVKENILFGKPFNKQRYQDVISACDLDYELSKLSKGDLTEIENNGSNIPSNMKQKVSLARACYSNRDIILIDCILENMEPNIQKLIFQKCIKTFLKDKTVLFVNNSSLFHSQSDLHVSLNFGRLEEKELKEYLPEDIETIPNEEETPKSEVKTDKKIEEYPSEYVNYFTEYQTYFYYGITFILLFGVSKLVMGWWISQWSSDKFHLPLKYYIIIYASLVLIHLALIPIQKIIFISGGMIASWELHKKMLKSVLFSPMSFFEKTQTGEILNRFLDDIYKLDYSVPSFFNNFFQHMSGALLTLIMIIMINPPSFFFIIIIGVLFINIQVIARKPQKMIQRFTEISKDPISSHVGTTITGLHTIRAYQNQDIFFEMIEKKLDYHIRSRWIEIMIYRWLSLRLESLAAVIVFITSAFSIFLKGTISVDISALAITFALTISEQFNSAMNVFFSAESGLTNYKRVSDFTTLTQEKEHSIPEKEPKNWPINARIEYQNVVLKYDQNFGLNEFSEVFGPNEIVGIIGKNGSGRTSLFVALFRLLELNKGSILIDGLDISQIGLKDLRSKISILPQESLFINGSIRFNLDPLERCSDNKIWNALESVNLKEKFVKSHIKLEDSIEKIHKLSTGEKQLISFVRLLLYKTQIILIDDSLSNIDTSVKPIVHKILKEKFKNRTVLIIAPNNDPILEICHRVVLMNKGKKEK